MVGERLRKFLNRDSNILDKSPLFEQKTHEEKVREAMSEGGCCGAAYAAHEVRDE